MKSSISITIDSFLVNELKQFILKEKKAASPNIVTSHGRFLGNFDRSKVYEK